MLTPYRKTTLACSQLLVYPADRMDPEKPDFPGSADGGNGPKWAFGESREILATFCHRGRFRPSQADNRTNRAFPGASGIAITALFARCMY